jgi:hypothetical protein
MATTTINLAERHFGADYKTPDWMRTAALDLTQNPKRMNAFFDNNPQYAQDWQNITSGGTSAFSHGRNQPHQDRLWQHVA